MFRSIGFVGDVLLKMWCDIIDGFDQKHGKTGLWRPGPWRPVFFKE